jgi:hypothetical protein
MTTRITMKHLQPLADRLNSITQNPLEAVRDGRFQPGCYTFSEAMGGVCLVQINSTGGAESDVFRTGHIPKRELYTRLVAFLDGLELGLAMECNNGRKDYSVTVESGASVENYLARQKTLHAAEQEALVRFHNEHPNRDEAAVTMVHLSNVH